MRAEINTVPVPVAKKRPDQAFRRISQAVLAWSRDAPGNAAITEDGTTWTYGELALAVAEAVSLMRAHGVQKGDRVMLIGENGLALAALILAVSEIDAWAVLENARRAPHEVDAIREHCQARRIFYATSNSPDARGHATRHEASHVATPLLGSLAVSADNTGCEPEQVFEDAVDQVAVLIYTTGTTGTPKGVMLTHGNLLYLASMMIALRKLTPEDRVYGVLPITHLMGLAAVLGGTLCAGAQLFIVPRFSPEHCVDALVKERISVMQGAPAMFAKLVQHMANRELHAPDMRFIAAGGAPVDPTVKQQVEQLFGLTLHNGYGLTEGSGICWTRIERARGDCSVGLPLPGVELRVIGQDGCDVKAGAVGELWARGPQIMKGYYRSPDLTAMVTMHGSWFNTQDLARIEADGHVFIEGRTKELIISSGFNVYPLEVENALNAHQDIVHSAVVGRSRNGNEEVVAFIELGTRTDLTRNELRAFLVDRISPYKRPCEIYVMQFLPTAPNGKVLKNRLKEFAQSGDLQAISGTIHQLN